MKFIIQSNACINQLAALHKKLFASKKDILIRHTMPNQINIYISTIINIVCMMNCVVIWVVPAQAIAYSSSNKTKCKLKFTNILTN